MKTSAAGLCVLSLLAVLPASSAPREWNRYFIQADQALLAGRFDEAVANYRQGALHSFQEHIPMTWDDLCYAFLQKKSTREALDYGRMALTGSPEDYDVRLYLAAACCLDENWVEARGELESIARDIRFDAGWLKETGGCILRSPWGAVLTQDEAERLRLEKGILFRPQGADAAVVYPEALDERNEGVFRFLQGLVLERTGDSEGAAGFYRAAIKAGFTESEAQAGRSLNPEVFLRQVYHRLKGHPNGLAGALHRNFLAELDRGLILEGIETLHRVLIIDSRSFELNHNLALLYFDLDDLVHAEKYGARAVWAREGDAAGHELMGSIYFREADYRRAAYEFGREIQIEPRNANGHYDLGSACLALNDPARAEDHWRLAIALDLTPVPVPVEKTEAGRKMEHSAVVKKTPVAYEAHQALGRLYSGRSETQMAVAEFEAAVKLKPRGPAPFLELGKLHLRLGDRDKAIESLEQYLYLGGEREAEAKRLLAGLKDRR
jgi:tetratricopeptide (TPR) repeat protein